MQTIRDRLTLLDILYEDDFSGHEVTPDEARRLEVNFYRGAPPQWLNFYAAEQGTTENAIIKRDGYNNLHIQLQNLSNNTAEVLEVSFNHEPGSGGTTLGLQLLWDLRRSFRCAVLADHITPVVSDIVVQVTDLYRAGDSGKRKPVLLLVEGDATVVVCRKRFLDEICKEKNGGDVPKVVILKCVRVAVGSDNDLRKKLSDGEKREFEIKKEWLRQQYEEELAQFHGFNIMQADFSQDAVNRTCDVFNRHLLSDLQIHASRLTACMCLLNHYVPGSFLLKSQCEAFLNFQMVNFEEEMEPFSHLIVSYPARGSDDRRVRMAQPMIAEQGILSGQNKKVKVVQDLLELCQQDIVTPSLARFVKDLLIKREEKCPFSKLISDMEPMECLLILKTAVKSFPNVAQFPQALSRFYYLKCNDYRNAEIWAEEAKIIAPTSSFIADTLGQVHKHNLKRKLKNPHKTFSDILVVASKAFKAFKHAEGLAEKEQELKEPETIIFNISGKAGFLFVANTLFNWKKLEQVTTNNHRDELIRSLPDEVKNRSQFISMLLSYSEKNTFEEDLLNDVKTCYRNYTDEDLPKRPTGPTENHLDVLLLNWRQYAQDQRGPELKDLVQRMKQSYEITYQKYFRLRNLLPIEYLLREDGGKDEGTFRQYKLYTMVGNEEIELDVDTKQQRFCRSGPVSFHLGFTIRGPTAYDIEQQ